MRKRFYIYVFSDNPDESRLMQAMDAYAYAKENGVTILRDGYERAMSSIRNNRVKDGLRPGWNEALNCHVRGERHFNQILKERGLEIIDKKPTTYEHKEQYITDDIIKDAVDRGAEISGNEAKALKEGKVGPIID